MNAPIPVSQSRRRRIRLIASVAFCLIVVALPFIAYAYWRDGAVLLGILLFLLITAGILRSYPIACMLLGGMAAILFGACTCDSDFEIMALGVVGVLFGLFVGLVIDLATNSPYEFADPPPSGDASNHEPRT